MAAKTIEKTPVPTVQRVEELYDLIDEIKLDVTAEEKNYTEFPKDFKVLLVTAYDANCYFSFTKIDDQTYKILAGATYCMTRKDREVATLYYKGEGTGSLRLTFWR